MLVVSLVVAAAALVVAVVALVEVRSASRRAGRDRAAEVAPPEDVDWQLQWIEPGVYFLANTSPGAVAFDVEVTSSLTPVSGGPGTSATAREQRVNPGAWLEVRHAGVGREVFDDLQRIRHSTALTEEIRHRPEPLASTDLAALAAADEDIYVLQDRIEFTLDYTVTWRSSAGVVRRKTPLSQRLVPSPVS